MLFFLFPNKTVWLQQNSGLIQLKVINVAKFVYDNDFLKRYQFY